MENREYTKVIEYVKNNLKTGNLQVGGKLETERVLAEKLQLSRSSIREALRSMENMGLIESRQGSGNYLIGDFSKNLTDSFGLMLMMKQVDYSEISQLRRAIEIQAYQLAVSRITDEQIEVMRDLLKKIKKAKQKEEILLDKEFHYSIISASSNVLMINIMEALSSVYEEFVANVIENATEKEKMQLSKLHLQILNGLKNKNTEIGISAINNHYDLIDHM